MQRVRVGLTGLAFVFLLVMLATAFLQVAGDRHGDRVATEPANTIAPAEPLAQLGVAPGNVPAETAPAIATAPVPTAGPATATPPAVSAQGALPSPAAPASGTGADTRPATPAPAR